MKYSNILKILIVLILAAFICSPYVCFYFDKKMDTYSRPWAYSDDPSKPLLVGKWRGVCIDPDQVAHQVEMEIFEPTTEAERWKRVNRSHRKKSKKDRLFFDGIAVLSTSARRDSCELWGGLDKADGQELHFQFSPLNGQHAEGFHLNLLKGKWEGDRIHLTVDFAWFQADGSSHYDSSDPRHDTQGSLELQRIR